MLFKDIIGQSKAKNSFLKMIAEQRLAHALILKGRTGIGKLAFATAIAQYINCENPGPTESCGSCGSCSKISKGIHPDVRYILPIVSSSKETKPTLSDDFFPQFRESFFGNPYFSTQEWIAQMDGENKQVGIKIAEIRDLKRRISLKAFEANYKVVIIWNAEKINNEAANAMLKLLEEPPEKTILILTVSDTGQLLTTINSRCQRIQMHRVEDAEIADYLQHHHQVSPDHALQLAQLADGDVCKAIELVKEANRSVSELYMAWLRVCARGNFAEIQDWVDILLKENKEFQKMFLAYALHKLRDSLLFSFQSNQTASATPEERDFLEKFARFVNLGNMTQMTRLVDDALYHISRNVNAQMVFSVLSLRFNSLLGGKVLI